MSRRKKAIYNIIFALVYQISTIVCNFILPRYFLVYFGSNVNGLISSIQHFLSFVTLMECGVGAVVQSSLYKPLAEKDDYEISAVVLSSSKFFKKILYVLLIYSFALAVWFPLINKNQYSYNYTSVLILILTFSYVAQYYLFLTYRLLVNADQLGFIYYIIHTITLILNVVVSIVLMNFGCGIHIVKLGSALVFLIQPLALKLYVNKHYNIMTDIQYKGEPIKQKWNGFFQHVATVVMSNTPTVVLTLFSTLESVSIYSVYYLVVNGIRNLIHSLISGIQSILGNMYAKKESEILEKTYSFFEWIMHTVVTVVFTCVGILIVPFIMVYTQGVTDANYCNYGFATMITLSYWVYCIRYSYDMMVKAAGHYKQTQISAIIEAVLHIVISMLCVHKFGLVGVSVGMFVAMSYRTVYFAYYISKSILYRKILHFYKHIFVDLLVIILGGITTRYLNAEADGYLTWIWLSIKVFSIVVLESLIINLIFYKKMFFDAKSIIFKRK